MKDEIKKKFASIKIRFLKNFQIHDFFYKIREIFVYFCFTMYTKKTCSQLIEDGREAPLNT